jgi:hypothetical protein
VVVGTTFATARRGQQSRERSTERRGQEPDTRACKARTPQVARRSPLRHRRRRNQPAGQLSPRCRRLAQPIARRALARAAVAFHFSTR